MSFSKRRTQNINYFLDHMYKNRERPVEHGSKKKDCGKLDDDVKRHLNLSAAPAAPPSPKGASTHHIHNMEMIKMFIMSASQDRWNQAL